MFILSLGLISCNKEEVSPPVLSNNNENSERMDLNAMVNTANVNNIVYPQSWWVGYQWNTVFGTNTNNNPGGMVDTVSHPEQAGFNWSSVDTTVALETELSLNMPPIGNQGSQGSCVSWACTYAAGSFLKHKELGVNWAYYNNNVTSIDNTHLLSPAYTYNQLTNNCGGTTLYQTLNLLKTQGACSLSAFPYNHSNCTTQPNSSQISAAASNKIKGFKKINNNAYIRWAIHYNYPVVFLAHLDQSFGNSFTTDGKMIWTQNTSLKTSYHAMCVIGFSNIRNAYLVQNSWGTGWGNSGRIWIDYNWFNHITNEVYLVR